MDLQLSARRLRFRDDLRAWVAANPSRSRREELRDARGTETSLIESTERQRERALVAAGYRA